MAHEFGVRLALIAFATTLFQGVLGRSAFDGTLQAGLMSLAAFYGLGWLCGETARRAVEESLAQREPAQPPPPASGPAA